MPPDPLVLSCRYHFTPSPHSPTISHFAPPLGQNLKETLLITLLEDAAEYYSLSLFIFVKKHEKKGYTVFIYIIL